MIEPIPFAGLVDIDEPETIYCSSCLSFKPFKTGKVIKTAHKNLKRFKCAECLAKISARRYEGKS